MAPDPELAGPGQPSLDAAVIVAATSRDVWRLHAHLVSAQAADDLTQETFERVLRALPGFRGEAAVRTWVLSIAARVAADEIRRLTRRRRLLTTLTRRRDNDGTGSNPAAAHELQDLLQRLDPVRREAFVVTQVLDLSYDDAAALLGVPIGTIRSRVARARADLVRALGDAS